MRVWTPTTPSSMDTIMMTLGGTHTTSLLPPKTTSLPPLGDTFFKPRLHSPSLSLPHSRRSLPRALSSRRGKTAAPVDSDGHMEEEGELFVPFGKMQQWLENKPRGFGEGKVYDTSLEDKLLEEIQLSRAQAAANLPKPRPDNHPDQPKDAEVPNGFRVRVFNLPKKKNVHRDLKVAFQHVPGVVSIVPAVSGNKKTKDPICRGFAFVYFKSQDDAARFAQQFSGQAVAFGKIQKQIKCQMMNSKLANSSDDDKVMNPDVIRLGGEWVGDFTGSDLPLEETVFGEFDEEDEDDEFREEDDMFDDEFIEAEFEDVTDEVESLSMLELNDNVTRPPRTNAGSGSHALKNQRDKNRVSKKDTPPKGGKQKFPKLEIPGSAKRLKIKEKAVLTGVLTKYASQSALATPTEAQRLT